MNAKTVLTAARYQLAQKNDLVSYFLNRYIEIPDPGKGVAQFIQLMVVRGK